MDAQPHIDDYYSHVLKTVDQMLPTISQYENFTTDRIIWNSNLDEEEKRDASQNLQLIKNVMIKLEYARYVDEYTRDELQLTPKGIEAKDAGGHFAYLKKLEERNAADKKRQKLNDEKLQYDVRNSKRIFKTYWWTFAFALLGLIISLVLAILKLFGS